MVAYSSIGHMGYVLLGAAATCRLAWLGQSPKWLPRLIRNSLSSGRRDRAKVGTRDLDVLNGLMSPARFAADQCSPGFGGMASAGIPGMAGFVADFSASRQFLSIPLTLVCVVCTGLTAVYFIILLNRTCFGKLDNNTAYYPQVHCRTPSSSIIFFFLGLQPTWLVRWVRQPQLQWLPL